MKYELGELAEITRGVSYKGEDYSTRDDMAAEAFINLKCISADGFRWDGIKYYKGNHKTSQSAEAGDLLIANTDLTRNHDIIGNSIIVPVLDRERICFSHHLTKIKILDETIISRKYLYYLLKSPLVRSYMVGNSDGTTVVMLSSKAISKLEINIPNLETQQKVVRVLSALDEKIELNNRTNKAILESIDTIFLSSFIGQEQLVKVSELANITIGKTPPRKEHECFTKDSKDIKWLSISDMGKIGTFAINTSEKLTRESIKKYSVKIVPKDTIVLSFKLTLGRIAILDDDMATNEAIAHFHLKNKELHTYYLFSVLRNYDYNQLGSTSSIATAINSKIVKSIPIALPADDLLAKYNSKVKPLFERIRTNERQNRALSQLRDSLLPKLMNSEVKI